MSYKPMKPELELEEALQRIAELEIELEEREDWP